MSLVVDSSALLAILLREDDHELYRSALEQAERVLISAVNLHETRIVTAARLADSKGAQLDHLLAIYETTVVPFDERQAAFAFEGYLRFGKGRHPARLNLADCAAYALAKGSGLPLLFKGEDFRRTDVRPAV